MYYNSNSDCKSMYYDSNIDSNRNNNSDYVL